MKQLTIIRHLALAALLLAASSAIARPAWRKAADVKQPDGTVLTLQLHGDEYLSFLTTTDGYTVTKDTNGLYCYANLQDGLLVPTQHRAVNPKERSEEHISLLRNMPKMLRPMMTPQAREMKEATTRMFGNNLCVAPAQNATNMRKIGGKRINYGDFKGLVILVEFTDRKFLRDDAQAFYQDLTSKKEMKGYNEPNGSYREIDGSVRDYFRENSMGIFDPTFDVVGPIQVPYESTHPGQGNAKIKPVLKAALRIANDQVDYTQYDLDDNGYVDMVYFIFAGYGSYIPGNNENYVWPHASDLSYSSKYEGLRYDGMMFSRYACSVEIQDLEQLASKHQYLDGIGTMCHEFSHVLGLADHYDTDYDENGQAEHPDEWDLMASGADYNGGYTPAGYSSYERYTLGFAQKQTLDVAGHYELPSFFSSNQFLLLNSGTRKEKFYIENRQPEAWDRFLPGHGLLVWRCDSTSQKVWDDNLVNSNPDHMYLQLLKAIPEKAVGTAYTPFPGQGNVKDLTYYTPTALRTWAGTEAELDLYDISESEDGIVSFNAGKNLYEMNSEDFEHMAYTTADAEAQQGVFTTWDFSKAVIASTQTEGKGNGERVAKVQRSGTITTAELTQPVRMVSLKVWTGRQQVLYGLKENSTGKWQFMTTNLGQQQVTMKKNSEAVYTYSTPLPAGTRLCVEVLGTSNSAVAYVDDITVVYDNNAVGIEALKSSETGNESLFNLSGQRVGADYRGIVVSGGKIYVER